MISTSSSMAVILLFHLLLYTGCSSDKSGAKGCSGERFLYTRQGQSVCERCTQKCSAEYNQIEITSCTLEHNRVCHCKPGFFCTSQNNYGSYCHEPCVPCVPGTFSSRPSLKSTCKPKTDCAKSGMIVLKEGTETQDRECGPVKTIPKPMAAPPTMPNPYETTSTLSPTTATTLRTTSDSITINSISALFIRVQTNNTLQPVLTSPEASPTHRLYIQSATGTTSASKGGILKKLDSDNLARDSLLLLMLLIILMMVVSVLCIWKRNTALKSISKWTGFISEKHEEPDWKKCQDASRTLYNSQSKTISEHGQGVELNLCSEVTGQNMGVTPHSGGGQTVNMEHNVKGENVSNTVGSIYIYSPGTVILGSQSCKKKEDAGVCEEEIPLISPPQQESTPPSHEVRITMSTQEEENTLSFPVPATGK